MNKRILKKRAKRALKNWEIVLNPTIHGFPGWPDLVEALRKEKEGPK